MTPTIEADPAVAVAAKLRDGRAKFNATRRGLSDEAADELLEQLMSVEEELEKVNPTTVSGVLLVLDQAIYDLSNVSGIDEDQHPQILLRNIRDALVAGVA